MSLLWGSVAVTPGTAAASSRSFHPPLVLCTMHWLRTRTTLTGRAALGSRVPCRHWLHSSAATNPDDTTNTTPTPANSSVPPTASAATTTQLPPDGRTFHFQLHPPRFKRVLFFGSDTFSLPTLQHLLPARPALVCPANKPQGRGNTLQPLPVRKLAAESGLECWVLGRNMDFRMSGWQLPAVEGGWDVGVVVSFGYKLPQSVIRSFRHGMINLHPSLLPRYRGASPIQHALWRDDAVSGVSVIDLHPSRMDAGDILLQLSEPISPTDTYSSLSDRLAQLGSKAVLHTLNNLSSLRSTAVKQSKSEGTKAPKLSNEWAALDFTLSAQQVYAHWRACHGYTNAYTQWKGERVNIVEMDGYDDTTDTNQQQQSAQVGDVRYDRTRRVLRVRCGGGGSVLVSRLHVANKPRSMDAVSFANGNMNTAVTRDSVRFEQPTSSADVLEWLAASKDDKLTESIADKT